MRGEPVERIDLLGKEGGIPPIYIMWRSIVTGKILGLYYCDVQFNRLCLGPMFR